VSDLCKLVCMVEVAVLDGSSIIAGFFELNFLAVGDVICADTGDLKFVDDDGDLTIFNFSTLNDDECTVDINLFIGFFFMIFSGDGGVGATKQHGKHDLITVNMLTFLSSSSKEDTSSPPSFATTSLIAGLKYTHHTYRRFPLLRLLFLIYGCASR